MSVRPKSVRLDPDALATLEEQRGFLRRSVADLELEHDAGDLDDDDYAALKDDYEARLASVSRAVDEGKAELAAARPPRSRTRTALVVLGVGVFAVLCGVFVARSAGRRDAGASITGAITQTARERNTVCLSDARSDQKKAIDCYTSVLKDAPQNVEALTYRGWVRYQSGDLEGLTDLRQAVQLDASYPDVHAFLAVVLKDAGCAADASAELARLDALNPPPLMTQLVAPLRAQLQSSSSSSAPTSCVADQTSTTAAN